MRCGAEAQKKLTLSTRDNKHSHPLPQYRNLLEGPIVVMGNSLHQVHLSTRNATDRSVPVVSNPHVQVPGVEVLKVLIEWDKILQGKEKILMISLYHVSANHYILKEPSLFCGSQGKQWMMTAKPQIMGVTESVTCAWNTAIAVIAGGAIIIF